MLARAPKLHAILDDLERCYRAARMWPELLAVLERAAINDPNPETRAARLKRLGDVLETKLGDMRSALTTYHRLAGLMPNDNTLYWGGYGGSLAVIDLDARTTIAYTPNRMIGGIGDMRALELAMAFWA